MSHRPIINVLTGKGPDLVNVVKFFFIGKMYIWEGCLVLEVQLYPFHLNNENLSSNEDTETSM